MGLVFRKRIGFGPLNLNLSKSGAGLSLGVRGFRVGVSSSGRRYLSAGLPGTGIYYRQFARKKASVSDPAPLVTTPQYPVIHPHSIGYGIGYVFGWLLILSPLVLLSLLVWRVMR